MLVCIYKIIGKIYYHLQYAIITIFVKLYGYIKSVYVFNKNMGSNPGKIVGCIIIVALFVNIYVSKRRASEAKFDINKLKPYPGLPQIRAQIHKELLQFGTFTKIPMLNKVTGICNTTGTCYFNVTIQVICANPVVVEAIILTDFTNKEKHCMLLQIIMCKMFSKKETKLDKNRHWLKQVADKPELFAVRGGNVLQTMAYLVEAMRYELRQNTVFCNKLNHFRSLYEYYDHDKYCYSGIDKHDTSQITNIILRIKSKNNIDAFAHEEIVPPTEVKMDGNTYELHAIVCYYESRDMINHGIACVKKGNLWKTINDSIISETDIKTDYHVLTYSQMLIYHLK